MDPLAREFTGQAELSARSTGWKHYVVIDPTDGLICIVTMQQRVQRDLVNARVLYTSMYGREE